MILTYQDYNRFHMNNPPNYPRNVRIPSVPPMPTMAQCIEKAVHDGYNVDFKADANGLTSIVEADVVHYKASEISIDNFYRFEGESDPEDSAVLYLISTNDGRKGTLTDAYGAYADEFTSKFITQVEDIYKKAPNAHS